MELQKGVMLAVRRKELRLKDEIEELKRALSSATDALDAAESEKAELRAKLVSNDSQRVSSVHRRRAVSSSL